MQRLHNWPSALGRYLLRRAQTKFEYGVLDCGIFVIEAIEVMTGINVAPELKGYTNRTEAFRAIKAYCGSASMEAVADYIAAQHGLSGVPVLLAQRGDPVVLRKGRQSSLGIVDMYAGYIITPYKDGLLRLPASCATKAFHV